MPKQQQQQQQQCTVKPKGAHRQQQQQGPKESSKATGAEDPLQPTQKGQAKQGAIAVTAKARSKSTQQINAVYPNK